MHCRQPHNGLCPPRARLTAGHPDRPSKLAVARGGNGSPLGSSRCTQAFLLRRIAHSHNALHPEDRSQPGTLKGTLCSVINLFFSISFPLKCVQRVSDGVFSRGFLGNKLQSEYGFLLDFFSSQELFKLLLSSLLKIPNQENQMVCRIYRSVCPFSKLNCSGFSDYVIFFKGNFLFLFLFLKQESWSKLGGWWGEARQSHVQEAWRECWEGHSGQM